LGATDEDRRGGEEKKRSNTKRLRISIRGSLTDRLATTGAGDADIATSTSRR
jgi:hypothetical protein